jgi:hypothetical protein
MRGRPSSEFGEVGEGRVVIIMSIPEWEITAITEGSRSEDG